MDWYYGIHNLILRMGIKEVYVRVIELVLAFTILWLVYVFFIKFLYRKFLSPVIKKIAGLPVIRDTSWTFVGFWPLIAWPMIIGHFYFHIAHTIFNQYLIYDNLGVKIHINIYTVPAVSLGILILPLVTKFFYFVKYYKKFFNLIVVWLLTFLTLPIGILLSYYYFIRPFSEVNLFSFFIVLEFGLDFIKSFFYTWNTKARYCKKIDLRKNEKNKNLVYAWAFIRFLPVFTGITWFLSTIFGNWRGEYLLSGVASKNGKQYVEISYPVCVAARYSIWENIERPKPVDATGDKHWYFDDNSGNEYSQAYLDFFKQEKEEVPSYAELLLRKNS